MSETIHTQRFLERLRLRDFDGLAMLFAPGATARFLLPRGPETQQGGEDISRRFGDWFDGASTFEVIATDGDLVGGRRRLSWRLRVVRATGVPEVIGQIAFLDIGPAGIERLDLLCSGFHQVEAELESCDVSVFDAGNLGCADGLAEEFRRRITAVPVGASLKIVAADPAAKEDLPPLARMLGHTVKSTGTLVDGRLTITVERGK